MLLFLVVSVHHHHKPLPPAFLQPSSVSVAVGSINASALASSRPSDGTPGPPSRASTVSVGPWASPRIRALPCVVDPDRRLCQISDSSSGRWCCCTENERARPDRPRDGTSETQELNYRHRIGYRAYHSLPSVKTLFHPYRASRVLRTRPRPSSPIGHLSLSTTNTCSFSPVPICPRRTSQTPRRFLVVIHC